MAGGFYVFDMTRAGGTENEEEPSLTLRAQRKTESVTMLKIVACYGHDR